ncbi:hypothetical protein HY065_02440, partial [Candidatus Berkelbacteria bacterium]|nr:hypothetical protein [Candidatus Berkelbacteria bacterium]
MQRTIIAGFAFWAIIAALGLWFDNRNQGKGEVLGASIVTPVFADEPPSIMPPETYYGNPILTSVNDILRSRNVTVFPEDEVRAFPDPLLGLGSTVKVYRATPLTVV